MKSNSKFRRLFSIVFLAVLITACGSSATPTSSSGIEVIETDSKQEVIPDIVRINNCGGMADTEQTATRSFSTNIEGNITAKLEIETVAEAGISAKYGTGQTTSKSIKLVAPPGTNMEFTLQWTEQTWIGRVLASGESGNYIARMPISVEQTDAKNLGCNSAGIIAPTAGADIISPMASTTAIAGNWAGTLIGGTSDFSAELEISIQTGCSIGDVCGTFSVLEIGCAGNLTLTEINGKIFSFREQKTSDSCGGGLEQITLLSDGTLSWMFQGGSVKSHATLSRK